MYKTALSGYIKVFLEKLTQSKSFSFEPSFDYQIFKLTADLHLTRNET